MISLPRCVAIVGFEALYFVTYLQDGFTTTHALSSLQRCVAIVGFEALYFVTYLQDGLTKHTHDINTAMRCYSGV